MRSGRGLGTSLLLIGLIWNSLSGQEAQIVLMEEDSSNMYFEKIMLDGQIAYRNETTNEIISQNEYVKRCVPSADIQYYNYDYWDCDRINPYRDVVVETPFKLSFDQRTFTHPVDDTIVITSRFGRRRGGAHRALDIDLVTGDYVRSVLPGKVRFVGYSRGHGKTVVIRHANEVETVYAHLSLYEVEENDMVAEGQIIGRGGNTGNSRGSHLHIEVRYKGVCIHPQYVFRFDGSRAIRNDELWITNALKEPRFHSSYRDSELEAYHTREEAIAAEIAEPRFHKVRRGDTLSEIGQRYNLGIASLCKLNKISRNSTLRIGQTLQVR